MQTQTLRIRIGKAINSLLPCFKVTEEEFSQFKEPKIRRVLKPLEYPGHPRTVPAYGAIENFFYFPLKEKYEGTFSQRVIFHEASHYVHSSLNPSLVKNDVVFEKTGECPEGHFLLKELVARYGNFVSGTISKEEIEQKRKKVYDKYGPEFLPLLARMSLEEVEKRGILEELK